MLASLAILSAGMPAAAAGQTVVLSIGSSGGGGAAGQVLECEDGSCIEFVLFEDGILGSDPELIRGCQNGALSMYMGVTSGAAEVVPEAALLDIPYLADSLEEYQAICDGTIVDWLQPYFHAQNLHLLTLGVVSFRGVFSSEPLNTPEDLAGLRLRIMENHYHEIYWNALGAKTFTINFDQLPYALRQNRINGAELPFDSIRMLDEKNLFPYFTATDHLPALRTQILNLDTYNSLTEAQKKSLLEHYRAITSTGQLTAESGEEDPAEVLVPDESMKAYLKNGQAAVIEQLKLELGEEIVEEFLLQVRQQND